MLPCVQRGTKVQACTPKRGHNVLQACSNAVEHEDLAAHIGKLLSESLVNQRIQAKQRIQCGSLHNTTRVVITTVCVCVCP